MKFKLLVLTLSLLTFSRSLFAKSLVDSVGVENHNGKRVIIYKIKKKDNYYSIARRYHVSPKELISYNDNAKMTIGHEIKIPTGKPFTSSKHETGTASKESKKKKKKSAEEAPAIAEAEPSHPVVQQAPPPQPQPEAQPENSDDSIVPTQYKVSAGETLYSIAKRFNTTVEKIMALNGLSSNDIHAGQLLNVKANTSSAPAPVPEKPAEAIVAKRDSTVMVSSQDSSNINTYHASANKFGLFEKDEKGVATWMDDDGLDANKKLVLHRTAPIGTVIKITNIMTNRTTFAKVVGRFTDNEQTRDVIIVMTKNVAESLGALDKRFQVNLSYGVPNEQ